MAKMNKILESICTIRDGQNLTAQEKIILVMLVSRGEKVFPSYEQILEDTGIGSRNTLSKCLRSLESKGYLIISKERFKDGRWSHNAYTIALKGSQKPSAGISAKAGSSDTQEEIQRLTSTLMLYDGQMLEDKVNRILYLGGNPESPNLSAAIKRVEEQKSIGESTSVADAYNQWANKNTPEPPPAYEYQPVSPGAPF